MRTYRRLHVRLSKGDREKLDAMLTGTESYRFRRTLEKRKGKSPQTNTKS
jgi:hypothetical protein